jgi:hypothetical protein
MFRLHPRAGRLAPAVFAALLAAAGGCAGLPAADSPEAVAPGGDCCAERLSHGKIFVLDGVGGFRFSAPFVRDGCRDAGLPHAVEDFYWSLGWGRVLADLSDVEHHRAAAARLVHRIREYRRDYPGRPVHLIGFSGGTGLAVYALEMLEEGETVAGAVLCASALSPDYDLSRALSRTDGGIVAVTSGMDWLVLGAGTWLFGTMDRRNEAAAGLTGFNLPAEGTPAASAYRGLRQFRWGPGLIGKGYIGGHLSSCSSAFVEHTVAGWIREADAAAAVARAAAARRSVTAPSP